MRVRLGLVLFLAAGVACGGSFPAEGLQQRVEAHLAAHRDRLRETLGHYALVYPVEPEELAHFTAQLRVLPGAEGPVLGAVGGVELHGGGVLALLLHVWRPEGRAARLDDAYPFAPSGAVRLGAVYDAYRRQLVLPEAGGLPRVALRMAHGPVVDRDAYALLGLLLEQEADLDRPWTTASGATLSANALLARVAAHHASRPPLRGEPADHSELHLVELLVAWAQRDPGRDLEPVQGRFLERDLDPSAVLPARDAPEVLAHFAESLGLLLAVPSLEWSPAERRRARAWLAGLEAAAFTDLAAVPPNRLAHLARGLELASRHRARLR